MGLPETGGATPLDGLPSRTCADWRSRCGVMGKHGRFHAFTPISGEIGVGNRVLTPMVGPRRPPGAAWPVGRRGDRAGAVELVGLTCL